MSLSVVARAGPLGRQLDGTARTSVSQEEHAYIEPAAGTIPTKFRYASGVFGQYIDKAVKLKVNLKSTAH